MITTASISDPAAVLGSWDAANLRVPHRSGGRAFLAWAGVAAWVTPGRSPGGGYHPLRGSLASAVIRP